LKLYPIILVLQVVLLSACTSHIHAPLDESYRFFKTGASSQTIDYFEYDQLLPDYERHAIARFDYKNYKASVITIPSVSENGQKNNLITAHYYASQIPGKKPLVIIMPLYGAYTYPPEEMTKDIMRRSEGKINVLHLQGEHYMIDWKSLKKAKTPASFRRRLESTVDRMRVNVLDVRRLVDWANAEPNIIAQRIGLLGFSHGAIVSSVVAVAEPRIHTTISVMGGANPNEIIASCNLIRTNSLRKAIMKRFSWDKQQYIDSLKGVFDAVNPAYYPGRVDARNALIVEALYDKCVPESARTALWQSMGRPERYLFKYGHRMAFMAMTPLGGFFMNRVIYDFLQRKLLAPVSPYEIPENSKMVKQ